MASYSLVQHTILFPGAPVYIPVKYVHQPKPLTESLTANTVRNPTIEIDQNAHQRQRDQYRLKRENKGARKARQTAASDRQ